MNILEGNLISDGAKIGIVVARFNEFITSKLLAGGSVDDAAVEIVAEVDVGR